MEKEQLKIKLENMREKIIEVENLLENPYNSNELEFELEKLEEEMHNFMFYLEERLY